MKKLVCFTLAMVFVLAGVAIAQPNHHQSNDEFNGNLSKNIVPLALGTDSVAVSANNNKVASPDIEVNDNNVRWQSPNIETDDVLSNNKVKVATDQAQLGVQNASGGGVNAGRDTNPQNQSNFQNRYIVDNAVLANVNVCCDDKKGPRPTNGGMQEFRGQGGYDDPKKDDCCPAVSQTNTFNKTQKGEIGGSFNRATGVSNANAAGGNMNAQTAYTTIGVAFVK
jgi:hypothetical protein